MDNERRAARPAKRVDVLEGIVNDGRKIPVWERTRLSAYSVVAMRNSDSHLDIPDEWTYLFIPVLQCSPFCLGQGHDHDSPGLRRWTESRESSSAANVRQPQLRHGLMNLSLGMP